MTNPIPWQRLKELAERATPGPYTASRPSEAGFCMMSCPEGIVADDIAPCDVPLYAALDPATVLQMVAEHAAVREALERARGCIKGLLARTPVRDVAETLAEIDAALTGGEP